MTIRPPMPATKMPTDDPCDPATGDVAEDLADRPGGDASASVGTPVVCRGSPYSAMGLAPV